MHSLIAVVLHPPVVHGYVAFRYPEGFDVGNDVGCVLG